MSAIEVVGLPGLQEAVKKWPAQVQAGVVDQIREEVQPMLAHMSERAWRYGKVAGRVADTAQFKASGAQGFSIEVGGSGKTALLMKGAEYGGRKRGKRPYAGRSPKGTVYIMRRRATQQFLPFLGSRGYWFWETARTDLKGINARVRQVVIEAIENG